MPAHYLQPDLAEVAVSERRGGTRYPVELPVVVVAWNLQRYLFQAIDLSSGGLLLAGDITLKNVLYRRKNRYTSRPVRVSLELGLPSAVAPIRLEAVSRYVWRKSADSYLIGMRFITAPPQALQGYLESLPHR